ncbi:carboxymuconolactone decarboxylase family protein [Nocardia sp. NPDC020380]|uniref:carboxymuconolactone decarboxylase family protein n=1 Tax=Nocardia sp. NPDC020380 TaxID=3364309 RepID=UPI0037AA057A
MTNTSNITATLPDLREMDPVFAQMATASLRFAGAVPELSDREKVLLRLTADVCQQCLGLPFAMHVQGGLRVGVSTGDIRALLRFISYDSGYHAALAAFERLTELEAALGLSTEEVVLLPDALVATGPGVAPSPMPESARAILAELDPHFAEYFDLQSRMRSTTGPGTLAIRERAFVTMSIDMHYQTLGDTFRIHTQRALNSGATLDDVRAVLRFNAQFGATRAWQSWRAFHAHAADAGWIDPEVTTRG